MPHQSIFQGKICAYDTKIVLNSDGIVIFLWNPHRRRCYEAKILYEYAGKSKEIQDIFTNLDEFYVYITEFSQDKERVNINESGRIQVTFHLNKSKNKNPPIVYIDTEVLLAGHQIKTEKKLYAEIGDIKRENIKLQMKINQLMKLNEDNKKEMEELKIMLEKSEKMYNHSSDSEEEPGQEQLEPKKRKKKYSVISGGKSGMKELNQTINELATELNTFKGEIEKKELKLAPKPTVPQNVIDYFDPLDESALYGSKMTITVDQNNRYLAQQYRVEENLITKIKGYGRFQILSKEVIPPIGRHYFVMFIEHISFKIFSMGIIDQRRRNYQNSHLNHSLISYFAKTGAIFENGDCRGGGPLIPNGVEIRIVVDMTKHWIKWYMDKREIASTMIGEHMRKERLVAYLECNYEGDRIYWNERTI